MTEPLVVYVIAGFFALACVALWIAWLSGAALRTIAREQHNALMAFNKAGQSLAAHELDRAGIDLAMRQADADKAKAEAMEARERNVAAVALENGTHRGRFGAIPQGNVDGP